MCTSSTSGACLPESEPRAEAREVTAVVFVLGWLSEPEEGVAFDRTLPQVLAFPRTRQLKHERMLLLSALQTQTNMPINNIIEYLTV